jgi:MscS family membrane protein
MTEHISPENIRLLLVLIATVLAHFLARRFFQRAENLAAHTDNIWDDSLVAAARTPLPVLIWLAGIFYALHLIQRQTGEPLLEDISPARSIVVVICVAWFLLRLIRGYAHNLVDSRLRAGAEVDSTTVDGLNKLSRIAVIVIAGLAIIQTLGFSISGVLAFGGMGGIAVGFAAKDLLANFFGGLMIHLDRPFKVGERIRYAQQQIEGTVEHIGWRKTILRSPDRTAIFVPNSLFISSVLENPSRMSHRRIFETIALRYDDLDKMSAIVEDVEAMLHNHPDIDAAQAIVVGFDQFADSSLNFTVQAFCPVTDGAKFQASKQDVLLKIAAIVSKHGAQMAFPTRTLYLNPTPP